MSIICVTNHEVRRRLKPGARYRKFPKTIPRHVSTQSGRPLCGKWKYKKNPVFQDDLGEPTCPLCLLALENLKLSPAS